MHNSHLNHCDWELDRFLQLYPELTVRPHDGPELRITGVLTFCATSRGKEISDSYSIEMLVPQAFPVELPRVKEVGGRIPQTFHRYSDGTLCLGSPIRLFLATGNHTSLPVFVERFLIPYLFGYSHKEQYGELPFGELRHGSAGIIDDLKELLGEANENLCIELLYLASLQRRKANRTGCPCGSAKRVGRCHNRVVNRFRRRFGRLLCRELNEALRSRKSDEKNRALMHSGNHRTKIQG